MILVDNTVRWQEVSLKYSGRTDRGQKREGNEDNFLILPNLSLFCIADGAGGHTAGARASCQTLTNISSVMSGELDFTDETLPVVVAGEAEPVPRIVRAIEFANERVHENGMDSPMASTVVAAHFVDNEVHICHVGDSRAYLLRNGYLERLTEDHSVVYELYKAGKISFDEMQYHPRRNIITQAIGPNSSVAVSFTKVVPRKGDIFLLCSDGLTSMVVDEDINEIIQNRESMAEAATALVQEANQRGGNDNITVILIHVC